MNEKKNDTESERVRKRKLWLGINVLQRFGRRGTIVADTLLREMPVDSPEFDEKRFMNEVQVRLATNDAKLHIMNCPMCQRGNYCQ